MKEDLKTEQIYSFNEPKELLYEYQFYELLENDVLKKIWHGFYKAYKNNKVFQTREYKNNQIDGKEVKYYETGEKLCEIEYVAGVEDGSTKYYHQNGNLQMSVNRVNGKYDGDYMEYNETGDVIKHLQYKDGELIQITV